MPAGHAAAGGVATLVQSTARETGFVVLLSVGLTATTGVAMAAALAWQAGDAAATLRTGQLLQCAPSAWAETAPKARIAAQRCSRASRPDARHTQPAKPAAAPAAGDAVDGGAGDDGELLFCTNRGKGRSKKRPLYQWTGRLRPHPISPYRAVPEHIARPDYASTGWPAEETESKKQNVVHLHTPEEVAGIRAACQLVRSRRARTVARAAHFVHVRAQGRKVLDACAAAVRPGVTTDELDRIAHEVTVAGGGYPSPLNYCSFPKSCCTSVNEVICHGIPDMRPLEDGDIVNLDISVYLNGFHGDLNETVLCGAVDEAGRNLVKGAWECLAKAMEIVKPGTRFRDVGDVISAHASRAGLSVVRTYCGHGIGCVQCASTRVACNI